MNTPLIAVVGLGLLGRGIAACLLANGFRVIACDRSQTSLYKALDAVGSAMRELAAQGAASDELPRTWHANYDATTSLAGLERADFVIESIVEDQDVKASLFDELEQIVGPAVPIASNTSAIPISTLQRHRLHPARFLGMHWAEPAHAARFLELIRGEQTSDDAFAQAVALAQQCRKEPSFVLKDVPGFVANRLGYAMYREALHLLQSGVADAETIDRSFRNSVGLWASFCGPFRWIDLTGGPELYAQAMAPVLPTLDATTLVAPALADLAAERRGFFKYSEGETEAWEERLRQHAWEMKRLIDRERPLEPPQ